MNWGPGIQTNHKALHFSERTTLYAVLQGVGIVFFPLMEFVGGQLYKYTGFYGVFGTSLGFTVAGIAYIVVIPETVTRRNIGILLDTLSSI